MPTEEKVSGGGFKLSSRKKRPYRSQLTVMYIVAVMACLVLGYVVGTRLLGGDGEQRAQTTMADVNGSNGSGSGDGGSSQQDAGSVLPPLSPLVSDLAQTGAGVDDTVSGTTSGAAPAVGTSAPSGGAPTQPQPQLQTQSKTQPQAQPTQPTRQTQQTRQAQQTEQTQQTPPTKSAQPAPKVASAVPASSSTAASTASSQRVATVSRPETGSSDSNQLFRVIVGRRDTLADAKALEAEAKAAGLDVWISGSGPYQVQVGAFKSRANAASFAERLQGEGFPEAAVLEPTG